jgi:hypothetical protein
VTAYADLHPGGRGRVARNLVRYSRVLLDDIKVKCMADQRQRAVEPERLDEIAEAEESKLLVLEVGQGERWQIRRAGTNQILAEHNARNEAVLEAREIAQRERNTHVHVQRLDGSLEHVPLFGRDPIEEKG